MIVTLGGRPGSGKTTVARMLAEKLGFEFVSAGEIFRDQARNAGMSLDEYGRYAISDSSVDRTLDSLVVDRVLSLSSQGKSVVADGRLVGEMLSRRGVEAYRVWIDADIDVRSRRISERDDVNPDEALRGIKRREDMERKRYASIYGIDMDDLSGYDLVIDSSNMTPNEVLGRIMDGLRK